MKVGASYSTGKPAVYHDLRITSTPNVDKELSKDNVVLINKLQEPGRERPLSIEEYTNKRMQPIVDEYNKMQKRKDRRINVPYSEYFRNKGDNPNINTLSWEFVVQYGEHENLGGEYYNPDTPAKRKAEIRDEYTTVYSKLVKKMQRKYPHLEIVYAIIHYDEPHGTPHMHLGVQPIGEDYKRGLSQQVSIGKALTLDGVERVTTHAEIEEVGGFQLAKFYKKIRHEDFEPILVDLGYEIKEEIHGRKHEEPSLFAAGMAEVAAAKEQAMVEIEQAKETAMAEVSSDRAKLEQEKEAQRRLSEVDVTPIPITPLEVKVKVAGKLSMQTETVSTVNPSDVEAVEAQLRATKMELEATKIERDELKPQASALKRIMNIIKSGTVFSKIDSIKEICREFPFFIHLEERKRLERESANKESQHEESIPAWAPPSKRTTTEKQKGQQTRRNPWGLDIS